MNFTTITTFNDGDDVLRIVATYPDPNSTVAEPLPDLEITALGWISATQHHYDPTCYNTDGSLKDNSVPRKMTSSEAENYCKNLLNDVLGVSSTTIPQPAPIQLW